MGLSKPQDLYFITQDGNVRRGGGGKNLASGQVAVANLSKGPTKLGAVLVDNFNTLPKTAKIEFRMGKPNLGVTKSLDNKPISSLPFTLNDVVSLHVDAPKREGLTVDDMIIGFNGKSGSEVVLKNGENEVMQLVLTGKAMGYLGYREQQATVQFQIGAPNTGDFTMQEIFEDAVERLKDYELMGQAKLTDYVDIIIVNSENPSTIPGAVEQKYFNLLIKDNGRHTDLAAVQAKYTNLIQRTDFDGEYSTYTVIAESQPSAFVVTFADKLKGCDDCPSGYNLIEGGFIYSITLEDDGTDATSTVESIPHYVASSAEKLGNDNGVGTYSFVTSQELTDTEMDTFTETVGIKSTARFTFVGEVADICNNPATTTYTWEAGKVCNATNEVYTITLADDECGNDKLAKLQRAYPDLSITIAQEAVGTTSSVVTLEGAEGTANINILGTDYLATFATDLETTAANFKTAHETALNTAGVQVSASGDTLKFTFDTGEYILPTITNATNDLDGTVAAGEVDTVDSAHACQTTYQTEVLTNVVCDECDPVFREILSSEAPEDFEFVSWEKKEKTYSPTAKMGIRFRAKPTIFSGSEEYRDHMDYIYEAPRIALVGGGSYNVNESYNLGTNGRFAVKILSTYEPPRNYGGNMRHLETMSKMYFEGTRRHVCNNYAKYVMGEETRFEGMKQYVDYAFTIHKRRYTQGWSDKVDEGRTYHFYAEVGKHEELEALLNDMAAAAGIPTVQAYGK